MQRSQNLPIEVALSSSLNNSGLTLKYKYAALRPVVTTAKVSVAGW